jgi:sarcosine oxidase, subunit alpha
VSDDGRTLPPGAPRGPAISLELEGQTVRAFEGEPVAVALYAAGIRLLGRSTKYHRPRGLFCASGHCASCLMRIDGRPNLRACVTPAHAGLRCQRQNAFPDPEVDLLRAADWLFPKGMDHHRLMTGSRLGNELFVKLVRQMGGTGLLPDDPPEELPLATDEVVDVCIVGAGPAGLAAAAALRSEARGARVLVVDDQDRPGGSLLAEPGGLARAAQLAAAAEARGAVLWPRATAIAYYPEDGPARAGAWDGPPGVLAVARPAGLARISARRFLYATGAYDQNLPVPDNDRPGVLAARAVGRLAFRWGVRPGARVVVATPADQAPAFAAYVQRLVAGLEARGVPCTVLAAGTEPGHDVLRGGGLDLDRDALAMAAQPAPASELPRHHRADPGVVRFDPARGGFCVVTDDRGRCGPGVFAAGDVTGYLGPEAAGEAGGRVGAHLAASLAGSA